MACVPAVVLVDDIAVGVECGRLFQAFVLRNSNTPQRGISGSYGDFCSCFLEESCAVFHVLLG